MLRTNKLRLRLLAALSAALAIPALLPACNIVLAGEGCYVGDAVYQPGDSFPDADGCNSCTCMANGDVACTAKACVEGCFYQGNQYLPGESFPDSDGCNTCECMSDGQVGCTAMWCGVSCTWKGITYQPGEEFPAGDDCNTCKCIDDGSVECTEKACVTCTYAGETHQPGDEFPALDGCNTCTCAADGSVGCTKVACVCAPDDEWWRHYVATDPAVCMVIDYMCPLNTTSFTNDCGCGCEQDAACPEYFDCMPPASCNIDQIKTDCPYSGIAL